MKIVINSKENKKLLQNFPQDPYADITVVTQYSKLHLVLAYLSIDSEYFANIDPGTKIVDLSLVNEESLLKVIKSLYGAQLVAYSVQELFSLYSVIQELQIQEYKVLLKESLQQILATEKDSPILNSIQMLQFCIKNDILVQELKNFHFDTKLRILESSKNYLQLNKLSQATLSSLLLDFYALKVEKADQIINHIMENYFNRKNIRPAVYFGNQHFQQLRNIWQKYHHKITLTNDFNTPGQQKNQQTLSNTVSNLSRVNSVVSRDTVMKRSYTNIDNFFQVPLQTVKSALFNSQNVAQNQILDTKISAIMLQLKAKDQLIKDLRLELKTLKGTKALFEVDSDPQDTETSLLLDLKRSKKDKQTVLVDLQNVRQVQSFQASRDPNNAARVVGKKDLLKRIFQQFPK